MTRKLFAVMLGAFIAYAMGFRVVALEEKKFEVEVEKDIVYGEAAGEKLLLDLYRPKEAEGKRPGVVLVHGGGWRGGDKAGYASFGNTLAAKGYVAISINYRLAPKHTYPAQLDDTQRAVRWLRANAKKYNVDPKRIGAHGGSAGGHLVLFLGSRKTRDPGNDDFSKYSSKVQCVVDFFGPSDFMVEISPQGSPIVESFIGKKRDEAPELWRDASPITFASKHSAPTLIIHGTSDTLVPISQSEKMEAALKKAGAEVTLIKLEGQGHGFSGEAQQQAIRESLEFFDKHLKP